MLPGPADNFQSVPPAILWSDLCAFAVLQVSGRGPASSRTPQSQPSLLLSTRASSYRPLARRSLRVNRAEIKKPPFWVARVLESVAQALLPVQLFNIAQVSNYQF